ncbi:MAG: hypothetical protein ACI81R_002875, partial [Bradymonadia bacterium]
MSSGLRISAAPAPCGRLLKELTDDNCRDDEP